jgi:hypothetical protein
MRFYIVDTAVIIFKLILIVNQRRVNGRPFLVQCTCTGGVLLVGKAVIKSAQVLRKIITRPICHEMNAAAFSFSLIYQPAFM